MKNSSVTDKQQSWRTFQPQPFGLRRRRPAFGVTPPSQIISNMLGRRAWNSGLRHPQRHVCFICR